MVSAIEAIGNSRVVYDGEDFSVESHRNASGVQSESWSETLLSKDLFHRAGTVILPVDRVEEAMPYMKRLPYLRMVQISSGMDSEREKEFAFRRLEQEIPGLEYTMAVIALNEEAILQASGLSIHPADSEGITKLCPIE
ncbi:MAG: hypothetical protein ACKO3V_10070 [Pirellula sp.]